jgi:hypothetical protein
MTPNARPTCYQQCATSGDEDWNWMIQNEFDVPGHQGKVKQVEVFQHIMFSETFAFDMAEQQEVINKFYQVGDVNDVNECGMKRPRRAIDPAGNQCLPNKPIPLVPAGR